MNKMSLQERDNKIMWHPFTQEKNAPLPIEIKSASGSYLYDFDGNKYLDVISSWWANLHGHSHPHIADAIYKQASSLEHVMFGGFTHEPAVSYCEMLQKILPTSLKRFFFSDNGSSAVEIAIKMALQYWSNLSGNSDKKLLLCFDGGYHGDTFGAMSVGVSSGFHGSFKNFFLKSLVAPYPATWVDDNDIEKKESEALKKLETILNEHAHKIAAVIIEPLIQGATGMRMCRPEFLNKALKMIRDKNVLIIFDEVMTGFGRTGTYFAMDQLSLKPDFICLSKGITGGALAFALTVTTEKIYEAFLGDGWESAFAHGHTYTANPIACSASIASLELLQKEDTWDKIRMINKLHDAMITQLQRCAHVKHVRVCGTILAFETNNETTSTDITHKMLKKGFNLRPLGGTIYVLPPYSITQDELEEMYEHLFNCLTSSE